MTMEIDKRREIYREALSKYGIENQVFMVMEEVGELLSALGKAHRGRLSSPMEVITEIADVSIMMEQMAENFGYDNYLKEKDYKINRLKERLDKSN